MSVPGFIQGFPQDGSNLGNTRVHIRENLDGTFLTLGQDHINNNGVSSTNPSITGTPGYHNVIRFQDQGTLPTTPAAKSNTTQAYTNTDTHSIQQVIFESKAGNFYQMTTMIDAYRTTFGDDLSTNTAGWTFLPGGLVQLYGFTPKSTASSQVVDFTALGLPPFSNINYIINVTPYFSSGTIFPTYNLWVLANGSLQPTTTSFTIIFNSGGLNNFGFYWTAIGKPA